MSRGLTESQFATVDAIVARLIPSDENGPGAREAKVVRYIDGALATEYSGHQAAYTDGLAAIDAYATSTYGMSFVSLTPEQQDAVLTDLERSTFFELLRQHALEGMFGDPSWGGNAELVGWALLGYAGPRPEWTGEEQQLGDA